MEIYGGFGKNEKQSITSDVNMKKVMGAEANANVPSSQSALSGGKISKLGTYSLEEKSSKSNHVSYSTAQKYQGKAIGGQ